MGCNTLTFLFILYALLITAGLVCCVKNNGIHVTKGSNITKGGNAAKGSNIAIGGNVALGGNVA